MGRRMLCVGVCAVAIMGCRSELPTPPTTTETTHMVTTELSAEELRRHDYRLLFVGNSHTSFHNLPDLVCRMIEHVQPGKSARAHHVAVAFLDDTTTDNRSQQQLDRKVWTHIILQAQKISTSGRFHYPTQVGVHLAKYAHTQQTMPFFYAEWGLRGVANDGQRTETIYQQMATEAQAYLVRVGRAWDIALAQQPELPLYAMDGNHQSSTGAFLTACVLCGALTKRDVSTLASFPYAELNADDRTFLAGCAAQSLSGPRPLE